ncbi:50S ribosomal protein L6 [Desulfuribacillus stibiiarsenatis]|uniref:Large ribosomal subunit protein uL6 n=1 Tax=Desulfuribacillus stibiiarsenatis TaxID=1390249 RepID=A0A1E5L879_9FIRM|nr:50S ribosomal protein L6 [Desulfuribacillus stibiiarsenatis]OEH86341.1 50S ribosomal protein L6 [Desulfuribacillus stibiiarsenatis]
MSRIGKKPIELPSGVEIVKGEDSITVKGPKGTLTKHLNKEMIVNIESNEITIERPSDKKDHRSLHGTTRTVIANMIEGVTKGFERNLELVGVGYRAAKQGEKLVLSVGYSHPVEIIAEQGLEIEVPTQTKITVKGIDKEKVGALAANIRSVREPEPYKGKGIKYENEKILRKEGKTSKK